MAVHNRGLGLRVIEEAFHRPEKAAAPALGEGAPQVGHHVKVVANLCVPLPCAHHPGRYSKLAAFGGTVTEVVGSDHVVAEVFGSNDLIPAVFDDLTWVVHLRHEGGSNYPWHVVSLLPKGKATPPVAYGPDDVAEEGAAMVTTLKIACVGTFDDVQAALWTVAGGPSEHFTDDDTFLDVSLEHASGRTEVLLCRLWKERASSPSCLRLLLLAADAVMFCGPNNPDTERLVLETLSAQGLAHVPRLQYLSPGAEAGGEVASVVLQGESAMPGVKHLITEMLEQIRDG